MTRRIINIEELEYREWHHGRSFSGRMGEIGEAIGAEKLGYNLTVVPAGKRAFPFHCHHAIEEMFFILEGEGEIRMGEETLTLRTGDVVCCPTGGPETAHQIVNTMDQGDLKYLAVSSMAYPDICQYPDSDKTLLSHRWQDATGESHTLRRILSADQGQVDYWSGED
jgi:uncharacterized cupin superfamily protein